jgi:phospholipid transport system substrate-binding protein
MRSFIFVIVWVLAAGTAIATKDSPSNAIRSANSRMRELLSSRPAGGNPDRRVANRVTSELRGLFDIGDLARRALADHWKEMSPRQREQLVETLRLIVERNYISQLRSNLDYEIEYRGEEPRGDDVLVKTVIKASRSGRPVEIPVEYVLREDGGRWRAYDVITDDVSLLRNYRSQFNRIIAKEGPDGLIRRMKERLDRPGDDD